MSLEGIVEEKLVVEKKAVERKVIDNKYPAVKAPNIIKFFEKARSIYPNEQVTFQYIKKVGFSSSYYNQIPKLLKFIGFIGSDGLPTGLWSKYRTTEYKKAVAEGVKNGYRDLFELYGGSIENISDVDIRNFFFQEIKADEEIVNDSISAFKTLCELSDFNGVSQKNNSAEKLNGEKVKDNSSTENPDKEVKIDPKGNLKYSSQTGNVTLNINIQLTLPPSMEKVDYEHFFEAMKKYLLS